jgi:mRNA interferase MazF
VWWAVLDPVVGTEMGGHLENEARPVLIVSDDSLNAGPLDKVIAIPMTTRERGYPSHVPVGRPPRRSFITCENVRSISLLRLKERVVANPVPSAVMHEVEARLRILLGL